jgi:phage tail sheath gpL-like
MNEKHTIQICEDGATREDGTLTFIAGSEEISIEIKKTDTAEEIAEKFNSEIEKRYLPVTCVFEATDALGFLGIK